MVKDRLGDAAQQKLIDGIVGSDPLNIRRCVYLHIHVGIALQLQPECREASRSDEPETAIQRTSAA